MENFLFVMLGGGLGAILRYFVTIIFKRIFSYTHYATFIVNITGCFIFGLLISGLLINNRTQELFFLTGLTGSYTTFSTFEYENIDLLAHEKYTAFLKYSVYSCICGVISVLAGILSARLFV